MEGDVSFLLAMKGPVASSLCFCSASNLCFCEMPVG